MFVPPVQVAWFWRAVQAGMVPWMVWGQGGTFTADVRDVPFILCPDEETRVAFAVELLREGASAPPA